MKKRNAKVNTHISLDCTAYRDGHRNFKKLTRRNKIIHKKVYCTTESTAQIEDREHQRFFGKDLSKYDGLQTPYVYCCTGVKRRNAHDDV